MSEQTSLSLRCPRCGRPGFVPLGELRAQARLARQDLRAMRLVLPDSVPRALAIIEETLTCVTGQCQPPREGA